MIYLDHNATTPIDDRVLEVMLPFLKSLYGNPSSLYRHGRITRSAIDTAREQVAALIDAPPSQVIFTSSGTESNVLALTALSPQSKLAISAIEHPSITEPAIRLKKFGAKVTFLSVDKEGLITQEAIENTIKDKPDMVSIMLANNETGVIQNLTNITQQLKEINTTIHTDAVQAMGKIPVSFVQLGAQLMSLSSHKIYGPKGVGVLYVGRKPRVRLVPLMNGGGQERGLRSGTLSPALCVGLGEACVIAGEEMTQENTRLLDYRDYFYKGLMQELDEIYLNGSLIHRVPGNLNISFAHVEGEGLMMGLKDLAVSSGSACTSASLEPSYVLYALGVNEELAHTSLRIGFGRFTTLEDLRYAMKRIIAEVKRLREMSPLWEMSREGIDLKSINWAAH